jgi:hypothetical protein
MATSKCGQERTGIILVITRRIPNYNDTLWLRVCSALAKVMFYRVASVRDCDWAGEEGDIGMDLSSLKSLIAKMETKSSLGLFFILILSLGIFILSYLFEEVLENSSSHSQWHYTERQTNNIVVQRKGRISISLLWEGLRRTAL